MQTSTIMRWIAVFCEGLGLLAIVAAIGWYIEGWLVYNNAQDWPQTDAIIVSTTVDVSSSTSSDARGNRSSDGPSYTPIVRYRFTAGGQQRQSDVAFLNNQPSYGSMEEANAFLADYPVGSKTKASVNPEEPDQAALIVNEPDLVGYIILALFGAAFAGAGALMARFAREEAQKEAAA